MARRKGQRKGYRRSLLETPRRDAFFAQVEKGIPPAVAATIAGINPDTVNEWLRRGRGADRRSAERLYVEFYRDYRRALAKGIARGVDAVWRGLPKNPQLAYAMVQKAIRTYDALSPSMFETDDAEVQQVTEYVQTKNVIRLTGEDIRRISEERIRREEGEVDDAERDARASLVTDSDTA